MAHRPACPGPAAAGNARCYAQVRTDLGTLATPAGYAPADLLSAYKLTPPNGTPGADYPVPIRGVNPREKAEPVRTDSAGSKPRMRYISSDHATAPVPRSHV